MTHINTLYLVHLSLAILNVLFCCFNKPHYCESGLCTKLFECNQTYSAGLVNCTCASNSFELDQTYSAKLVIIRPNPGPLISESQLELKGSHFLLNSHTLNVRPGNLVCGVLIYSF